MTAPEEVREREEETTETSSGTDRRREIAGIVLIAASVLGFISLTGDAAGWIGFHLARFLRGLAGSAAFFPPLLLCWIGILVLRGKWGPVGRRRALGIGLAFLAVLVVLHVGYFWPRLPEVWAWREQVRLGLGGAGGGVVGAWLASILMVAFGPSGTGVLVAAALLVAAVLVFELSLSQLVVSTVQGAARLVWGALRWVGLTVRATVEEGLTEARRSWERRQLRELQRKGLTDAPGGQHARAAKDCPQSSTTDGISLAEPFSRWRRGGVGGDASSLMEVRKEQRAEAPPVGDFPGQSPGEETAFGSPPEAGPDRPGAAEEVASAREGWVSAEGVARGNGTVSEGDRSREPMLKLRDWRGASRYRLPVPSLLELPRPSRRSRPVAAEPDRSRKLEETLASFGVEARVVNVSRGPVITRYELQPGPGVKVSRITSLVDDLSLALAAAGLRIEAPVPGKSVVGIEVPNQHVTPVYLREVLESEAFLRASSVLSVALGKDIAGQPVVADLKKILHLLIAGATGSGKSVCLNAIIVSLLYKARPTEVKFIMIDPKRVELAVYDGVPHLITPVVTDPRKAAGALRWAVKEMERRYQLISGVGARNIDGYNAQVARRGDPDGEVLPYLVVIIDELADLMLVAAADVEDAICRLAQMARAAGIYLIIATQRPSVDVITGLIKANVPSRISFAVSSQVDSRTILDMAGAERLLGKGDMLFHPLGSPKPQRVQGAFIGDREVEDVVNFWKAQESPDYREDVLAEQESAEVADDEVEDELFEDAVRLVREQGHASVSLIQRRFRVGYSRAARLIDMMEMRGIVGPYQGSKPREVLKTYHGSGDE